MSKATVSIRIRGYQFSVSAPYRVGEPMGEAEVCQLNDLRADNIRNNLTKPVLEEIARLAPGAMLTTGQLAGLQAMVSSYDSRYSLQLKHQARPRVGAIEAEARAIAEERLDSQLREAGVGVTPEEYERLCGEMIQLDTVQQLARERLRAKQTVVQHSLGDL